MLHLFSRWFFHQLDFKGIIANTLASHSLFIQFIAILYSSSCLVSMLIHFRSFEPSSLIISCKFIYVFPFPPKDHIKVCCAFKQYQEDFIISAKTVIYLEALFDCQFFEHKYI